MRLFLLILFWTFFLAPKSATSHSGKHSSADSIHISGSCWDVDTGIDLRVSVMALVNNAKVNLGKSNDDGKFDLKIPSAASDLIFEAAGYRTIKTPVRVLGELNKKDKFTFSLRMILLDSQQVVKEFAGGVEKNKTNKAAEANEKPVQTHFRVVDAYQGIPLTAKICLTFTRTGNMYCLDTDSSNAPTASFVGELDKISLKITAKGFQDYEGDLIPRPGELGEVVYQISMLKTVKSVLVLNFHAPDSLNLEYTNLVKGKVDYHFQFIKGRPWTSIALENIPLGEQTLVATNAATRERLWSETYSVLPGINFKSINVIPPPKKIRSVLPSETNAVSTSQFQNITLYFDQSSYVLRPKTKFTLDSVSRFLLVKGNLRACITGHTDNVGKRELNFRLSEYRARVVANYLSVHGVQQKQIEFRWKGPDAPIASNDVETNKEKNRRVEISFSE